MLSRNPDTADERPTTIRCRLSALLGQVEDPDPKQYVDRH